MWCNFTVRQNIAFFPLREDLFTLRLQFVFATVFTHLLVCVCLCIFVQLFKGKFFYCDGLDVSNITNKTQCLEAGHRWARRKYNFDNLGQVQLTHTRTHTDTL